MCANSRIEVVGAERLDAIRASSGKPVVFVTGHFANWEVMASAICNRPLDCADHLSRRPTIPTSTAASQRRVTPMASTVLTPKGAGTRELMRALGRGQSIALMNDQKFNQGIAVPFFGHEAMTAPGPTRLAMKFKAPLLPISCKRLGPARYRVTFHEPFMPDADPDEDKAIYNTVLRINRFTEAASAKRRTSGSGCTIAGRKTPGPRPA
jgi:KDO2-lipid IV(A) lauroyltransferase